MATTMLLAAALRFAALLGLSFAQENETHCNARNLMQIAAKGQRSRVSTLEEVAEAEVDLQSATPMQDVKWITNINRHWSACTGSDFFLMDGKVDNSNLELNQGLVLKKGRCSGVDSYSMISKNSKPMITKELSCNGATGCHPWCSPVWTSDADTKNWALMDETCRSWDGRTVTTDNHACGKTSQVFSWVRTQVPSGKNRLFMKFGIPESTFCKHWCAPLWITLYDADNFGKSYRWCFNHNGDWGGCDTHETVSAEKFHSYTFKLHQFFLKHMYKPKAMKLELAIWNEFLNSELAIQNLTFYHKAKAAPSNGEITTCGGQEELEEDMKCCPKAGAEDGQGCPASSYCCAELCCPSYYICKTELEGDARCSPPPDDKSEVAKNITICSGDFQ